MVTEPVSAEMSALVEAGISGPHQSHSRQNVLTKIRGILTESSDDSFGLSELPGHSEQEVLSYLSELTGCSPDVSDPAAYNGIDPVLTVRGIAAAARRLTSEARRGATLLAATGHPTGMLEHYIRVVEEYRRAGGKVLCLRGGERLLPGLHRVEVRYIAGVGCLVEGADIKHTHSAQYMEKLLEGETWPDIVLGDHGFAGAAVERSIPTVAVMDINDPALAVASARGEDVVIVPMDDNRAPGDYEPASRIVERVFAGDATIDAELDELG